MSLKGFPSNQKNLTGTGITNEFANVSPKNPYQHGLELANNFVYRVGSIQTAGANTGYDSASQKNWVVNTATEAKVGDLVRFETGPLAFVEIPIIFVETNRFQIPILQSAAAGNTFFVLRRTSPRVDEDGILQTDAGGGGSNVIQFDLDGADTDVSQDTAVPANSNPLPVQYLNPSGVRTALATEATSQSILTAVGTLDKYKGFSLPFNKLTVVTKNGDGSPTLIESRLAGVLQESMVLTYDLDGDFQDFEVT